MKKTTRYGIIGVVALAVIAGVGYGIVQTRRAADAKVSAENDEDTQLVH